MPTPLLTQIVIVFGLTVAVLFVCDRFRIPPIVGFLLSGMMAGPSGFGLVPVTEEVNNLAEIGVVMLLFTIGIEFSLNNLLQIRKYLLIGGSLQVFVTLGLVALFYYFRNGVWSPGIFMGFLIALSSTAVVLKILQQRDEVGSPHGRMTLAILIFQDIIVVPMMLVTPILAGQSTSLGNSVLLLIAKAIGIIAFTFVGAQYLMPQVLFQVARMRSREIFMITIMVTCMAVAWFTSSLGLSLSLGAFLAGLIISESEYSQQALSNIMPFRDIFTSFFFISIGMLLDVNYVIHNPLPILFFTLAVFLLKSFSGGFATFLMGFPGRTNLLVAVSLAQVGEFSFVLSKVGLDNGLLGKEGYQQFLAVSILTMAISPFVIPYSHKLSDRFLTLPLPRWLREGWRKQPGSFPKQAEELSELEGHLVIIGMGVCGKNVARAAKAAGIPYTVIEMNADTVRKEKAKGEPIFYGDAVQGTILSHLQISKARILVVAIPDPVGTRGIVAQARRINPGLFIVVRTHYMKEMKPLFRLGANEVVPEEFETSIEIFTIVMMKYLVPRNDIDEFIAKVRADGYRMFRSMMLPTLSVSDLQQHLGGIDINTFQIKPNSPLAGRTLEEAALRQTYGVNLLAIIRDDEVLTNPGSDTLLFSGDKVIVFGKPSEVLKFAEAVSLGKKRKHS